MKHRPQLTPAFLGISSFSLLNITAQRTALWFTIESKSFAFIHAVDNKLIERRLHQVTKLGWNLIAVGSFSNELVGFGRELFQFGHSSQSVWQGSSKGILLNLQTSHVPKPAHFTGEGALKAAFVETQKN